MWLRPCSFRRCFWIYQPQPTSIQFNQPQPIWKKNTNLNPPLHNYILIILTHFNPPQKNTNFKSLQPTSTYSTHIKKNTNFNPAQPTSTHFIFLPTAIYPQKDQTFKLESQPQIKQSMVAVLMWHVIIIIIFWCK